MAGLISSRRRSATGAGAERLRALATCAAFAVMCPAPMGGCAAPAGPVFPALADAPFWPPPPEQERIRYVGSLAVDADLKPGSSLLENLGKLLFGRRDTHRMVTPYAITTDGADRVFVCDSQAGLVHVFDLRTRRYEQWRPGSDRGFARPVGLAWDPSGRLFVADAGAGVVVTFDARGRKTGEIGAGLLERPCGLAFDAERGRLYVADTALHRVIALDAHGQPVAGVGGRGAGDGEFNFPTNVAVDGAGRLYVSDSLNFRVQVFDADLGFIRRVGERGGGPGQFSQPKGLAVDSEDRLYVVDAHFEAVQIFDTVGRLLLTFGREGVGAGEFWLPAGVHADAHGRIWVADSYNRRVQVFALPGAEGEGQ